MERTSIRRVVICLLIGLSSACGKGTALTSRGAATDGTSGTSAGAASAGSGGTSAGSAGDGNVAGSSAGSAGTSAGSSGVLDAALPAADGGDVGDASQSLDAGPAKELEPTNVDTSGIDFSKTPDAKLDCGTTVVDTSKKPATLTNWCGTAPKPSLQTQSGGPDLVVIAVKTLQITSGNTLKVIGPSPVVLVVQGDATIAGTIDASATEQTPGAGGNVSCSMSSGGAALASTCEKESGGGGGGGFGSAGGQGGRGDNDNGLGGIAGMTRGTATLSPLIGGCSGGSGGAGDMETAAIGGAGGGAVQLSVFGSLSVTGTIAADGGVGQAGLICGSQGGAAGGGSGGAILLEASKLTLTGAMIHANGGSGGAGEHNAGKPGAGATALSAAGKDGGDHVTQGGGGGGGGYGRVIKTGLNACTGCSS